MSVGVTRPARDLVPRWHAALSYALLGRVPESVADPGQVDVVELLRDLDRMPGGLDAVKAEIAERRSTHAWPHPVPENLMYGLGPAQFASALTALRRELGVDARARTVRAARSLDEDERRLQADVPPHHGA